MNVKREPAIIAAMTPGEWLTHSQIHERLSNEYHQGWHPQRNTAATLRRMARNGIIETRKTGAGNNAPNIYRLKENTCQM